MSNEKYTTVTSFLWTTLYLPVVVSVFAVVVSVLAHSSGLIPLQYGDTQKREFRWDDH